MKATVQILTGFTGRNEKGLITLPDGLPPFLFCHCYSLKNIWPFLLLLPFSCISQISLHCQAKNLHHFPLSFRLDPPGQAISTATQELLRLAEANPSGIATLDPVNDLQLKSVDVVEANMRLRVLQDSLRDFNCIHSPMFAEQVCVCVCACARDSF